MYEIFSKYFKIEQYMSNHRDKGNPLRRLTTMQEVLISLLNRCVHGAEGINKFLTANVGLRPNSLSQIRELEKTLKRQIKIYEYGKFEEPGSREDEFVLALNKAQVKTTGSKLLMEVQMVVSVAMIILIAERAENSSKLTIKYVMTKYRESVVQDHCG
jgi:hypothetical protein